MSSKFEPLLPATLAYDHRGIPTSPRYQDLYHPDSGALGQARHVFLRGNQLPARWQGKSQFTVCEAGFGLGHNFLALWQAWRADPKRCGRLHVVAFESHPLCHQDLQAVLRAMPAEFAPFTRCLLAAWPPLVPGIHRLEFDAGAVTLTLVFGSIARMARQVSASVDAYFLDGFTPQRNPEMWSPALFGQFARMANAGATLASWCSAGQIRRDLRDAGFLVSKVRGFASKREMTVAVLRPGMGRQPSAHAVCDTALVVGGGVAGAGIAHALALRGHEVTVLDPVFADGLGASHKGHVAAAMTPVLSRDDDIRSRISRAGIRRALHRWKGLGADAAPLQCGTLSLALDAVEVSEAKRTLAQLKFPVDWVKWLDPREASMLAGQTLQAGGTWLADGSLVRPQVLLEALLDHPAIRCVSGSLGHLGPSSNGLWAARDVHDKIVTEAQTVVLANAFHAGRTLAVIRGSPYLPKLAAMYRLGGQVSYFKEHLAPAIRPVIAGDGYWLPAIDGLCVGGSTYEADILDVGVNAAGRLEISKKVEHLVGMNPSLLAAAPDGPAGWAGWRATPSDRLPIIGQVAALPGLWLACGYGSRGFSWSALAGDIVAATVGGEPVPLERELLRSIAPR